MVSGDTLAMHVALAYKKTCTTIFNCTSPQEIYDYGLMKKIVSPLLDEYFYSSSYDTEVIKSLTVDEVIGLFLQLLNKEAFLIPYFFNSVVF